PFGSASTWREVEDRPERGDIGRTTRVLTRVRHFFGHLTRPEKPHLVAVAFEHDQRGILRAVGVDQAKVVGVIIPDRLHEIEVPPAALCREGELPLNAATAEDLERNPLFYVSRIAVHCPQPVGAHRTWTLALRPIHPEISDQLIMLAEQVD